MLYISVFVICLTIFNVRDLISCEDRLLWDDEAADSKDVAEPVGVEQRI